MRGLLSYIKEFKQASGLRGICQGRSPRKAVLLLGSHTVISILSPIASWNSSKEWSHALLPLRRCPAPIKGDSKLKSHDNFSLEPQELES